MSTFNELSSDKQNELIANVNSAIKDAGLAGKVNAGGEVAHVTILNQGQSIKQGSGMAISGIAGVDQKDLVDSLKAKLNGLCDASGVKIPVNIDAKYGVGDKVEPIEDITPLKFNGSTMEAGSNVTLKHTEGEVILLDLWATWCPPCQPPMKHNVEMLAKGKPAWKDRVRLCGLSGDQDINKLKTLIVERNYQNYVEHYHHANGKCTINAKLGSRGIPHVALLNPQGVIVFKGHPSSINLEQAIDDLLEKGESDLCPLPKAGAEEEAPSVAEPKFKTALDGGKCAEVMNDFEATQKALLENEELKQGLKSAQRAFFVMEHDQAFSPSKNCMVNGLTCHLVLVGAGAAAGKVKELVAEFKGKYADCIEFKEQIM